MRYLKLYENDDWRRRSADDELVELSLEIDDILLEISDDGFPFVQPAFINRDHIQIEVVGDINGRIGSDEFKITQTIQNVLERLIEYVESKGYNIKIGLYFYSMGQFNKGYYIRGYDGRWFITQETDRLHNVINNNERYIGNLLSQEPDWIGINISKKI